MKRKHEFISNKFSILIARLRQCNHCCKSIDGTSVYLRDLYNGVSWNPHDTEIIENRVCNKHRHLLAEIKKVKEDEKCERRY
jgi:hypothetical protein